MDTETGHGLKRWLRVKAHTIKSEPPEPTCWKESLAVRVAKCPPPARTVLGRGYQKRRHLDLGKIFLNSIPTQNSGACENSTFHT